VLAFGCFVFQLYKKTANASGGGGGIGGRSDPAEEGITLIDTCMPRKRMQNAISDMKARGRRDQGLASRDGFARKDEEDDML